MLAALTRPFLLLRLEGATLLVASVVLYFWATGGDWLLFVLLLFAPDLGMVGYLASPRLGAASYNLVHSYPLPTALALYGVVAGIGLAVALALIWLAHIGLDRMLGYGLKHPTGFKETHLGRIGPSSRLASHE